MLYDELSGAGPGVDVRRPLQCGGACGPAERLQHGLSAAISFLKGAKEKKNDGSFKRWLLGAGFEASALFRSQQVYGAGLDAQLFHHF